MSKLSPIESQSPSKENDSIDDHRKAGPSHEDDEFEDSLNQSISEHISEEIESNYNLSSAAEDSIDKSARQFDQGFMEKKRKLFNFEDSDKSDAADNDGIRKFTKFDTNDGKFDDLLSGDNIAKHFMTESVAMQSSVDERVQHDVKIDEQSLNVDEDGAVATSKKGSDENNDVILINDHEISLTSLKQLQKQRSHTETEPSPANQTNQNTTSDISDLLNEDKESIEDVSSVSVNESRTASSKRENDNDKSVEKSSEKSKGEEEEEEQPHDDEEMEDVESIQKCKPMSTETQPELSVIEEVSAAEELSGSRNLVESNIDKKNEIRKIVNEAIDKLPLEKENRPPNLHDELLSVDSKYSQNSTTTDGTVYNAFAKVPITLDVGLETELNLNLIHMQNKIKELQNISSGKYSVLDLPVSGRRDSLKDSLKDFPQSGRESTSITTNSTEYRPFQDEYFRVSVI